MVISDTCLHHAHINTYKTKSLKINLSATLEQALTTKLAKAVEHNWKKENQRAVQAYNDLVEENTLFADENRSF